MRFFLCAYRTILNIVLVYFLVLIYTNVILTNKVT
nr:MAG TPA: hypothetical protein [Caudoviricetes sp.]